MTYIRQLILNAWWHFGEIMAYNESLALEITQREGQHALSDFTDLFSQCRKAEPIIFSERKAPKNRHSPFVT
ncbi:hypothetical protein D3C80_1775670 [compost metagenome]